MRRCDQFGASGPELGRTAPPGTPAFGLAPGSVDPSSDDSSDDSSDRFRLATGHALLDAIEALLLVPPGTKPGAAAHSVTGMTHPGPGTAAAAASARLETALRETTKLLRCLSKHLWVPQLRHHFGTILGPFVAQISAPRVT